MKGINWTLADVERLKTTGKIVDYKITSEPKEEQPKKSKYKNVRVVVDGIKFASIREANHYKELKFREQVGDISELRLQVKFELNEGGTYSYKYIADFTYIEDGRLVVVDAKGNRTATYKKKAKLMQKLHGITIKEV